MTVKVGLKRMDRRARNIDEAGAIDALVKALRSASLDGQLKQSSKSPRADTFRQSGLSPAKTYFLVSAL